MIIKSVWDLKDSQQGRRLTIVAPGPSYDRTPKEAWWWTNSIFALNAAITHCYQHGDCYWISHDHDRSFQNPGIRKGILSRVDDYRPWRTVTQRKFIPGEFGNVDWIDKQGRPQGPIEWRLNPPPDSEIYWYHENEGFEGHVKHGETVLELALEVATIWGFSTIFLVGVDLCMVNDGRTHQIRTPRAVADGGAYYGRDWAEWKTTPLRIYRGKMDWARNAIRKNRSRWPEEIYLINSFWEDSPFKAFRWHERNSSHQKNSQLA